MNKEEAQLMINKYLDGQADARERALIERWYQRKSSQDFLTDAYGFEHLADELWTGTKLRAGIDMSQDVGTRKQLKLWRRISVAAAAVAAITAGFWFYNPLRHADAGREPGSAQYVNDIAPGKNTATITLASGKVINLDTNKASVIVTDSVKSMTMLTASTPRGGTYQVVLPDGTKVWLNADSKISFPSQFTGKERKILLSGEGYFEVAKDKAHPFIVKSNGQEVVVLGTHFNINAYQDEGAIKTTLLEGSVKVSKVNNDGEVIRKSISEILKPSQQAILSETNLDVISANVEQIMAWKNGKFAFNKQNLQEILRGVARWYNVEVVYEPGVQNIQFTGSFSRFQKLSTVLRVLELTEKVHFKLEGRRVTVMK